MESTAIFKVEYKNNYFSVNTIPLFDEIDEKQLEHCLLIMISRYKKGYKKHHDRRKN